MKLIKLAVFRLRNNQLKHFYRDTASLTTMVSIIKIISEVTDEDMASLEYDRCLYWHWIGSHKLFDGSETIQSQELADRGIADFKEEH